MAAKSVHPRSFANNSVLAVGYVWKQPDVPVNGSGRPAFDAHLPKTVPWHSPELPKMDLQGVNGVEEARVRPPRQTPLQTPPYCAPADPPTCVCVCVWWWLRERRRVEKGHGRKKLEQGHRSGATWT